MAPAVIMVLIVFHGSESDWFPWHHSFAEHFRDNKDDEGSKKASTSQEINQGVASGGQHVRDY
jgi:hypothetical protein